MPHFAKSHEQLPLYLSEREIADFVLPSTKADEWPDIYVVLEPEGLPRIDSIMGGRYWPHVREWLDHRHGLRKGTVAAKAVICRAEIVEQIYDLFMGDDEGTQA